MRAILNIIVTAFLIIVTNPATANTKSTGIANGYITLAKLTTAVTSNEPNHLIDASITAGKYKGAKLHGKLVTTKDLSTNSNTATLTFTTMDINQSSKPATITAYAIDINTARTAIKSHVGAKYLQRNGTTLAKSFIQSFTQKSYQSLSGYSNNSLKIDRGTDVGILFAS